MGVFFPKGKNHVRQGGGRKRRRSAAAGDSSVFRSQVPDMNSPRIEGGAKRVTLKNQVESHEIVELTPSGMKAIDNSPLLNDDLRPTRKDERTWETYNISALWIGMAVCIPTYQLSSGLIAAGMNWWQAVLTILLGQLIVLIPLILNAHAGTKFGIPYPVFARLWYGVKGSHIPSIARAIVAAGWFGIQTWIGGSGLDVLFSKMWSGWSAVPAHLGVAFILFWGINVWIAYLGPDAIKKLESWGAPILIGMGLVLLWWAYSAAGGWGPMLSTPSKFQTNAEFLKVFFPALTGMIGFWATLALNIPDFTRYAKSQKAQIWGQIWGLPTTMALYSFIGVAVTSATVVVYGEAIWDPVILMSKFPTWVVLIGTAGIILATITTNIAANVVAPVRAFENLLPRKLTWGHGVLITGLLGIAMQPWYIMANFSNYIFGWLGTYAAFLGPIDGVAFADYWLVRKRRLDLVGLYTPGGRYDYRGGINLQAVWATLTGIFVGMIGKFIPTLSFLADNSWVVGLIVSAVVYWALMQKDASQLSEQEYLALTEMSSSAAD